MKKTAILFLILFPTRQSIGQDAITSLQSVYDLGLVALEQPFLVNRNAALSLGINQFQVGLDFNFSHHNRSIIAVTGPLGYNFAMAASWDRMYHEILKQTATKVTRFSDHFNRYQFAAAHAVRKNIKIAHQISITTDVKNDATLLDLKITDLDSLWDRDRFLIRGKYQLGLLWELSPKIKFGMLTPAILGISQLETRIAKFETKTETEYAYWGKKSWKANLPELAIEYTPTSASGIALALGKRDDDPFLHLGAKAKMMNRVLLSAGYEQFDRDNNKVLVGVGSFYAGFHGFYSYDISNHAHGLSLSFSPQQQKQLVLLSNFEQKYFDIFSYKLHFYRSNAFIVGQLQNLTRENVSLHIELNGRGIDKFKESFNLVPREQRRFQINFPALRDKTIALATNYQLRIVAFQRERQVIEKTVPVRLRDIHQWNGEIADLVYFVQPAHPAIIAIAQKITNAQASHQGVLPYARKIFRFLSDNFAYLKEPPLQETDYVQFPHETLSKRSGDCEDLCLLYSSLLGAVGILTALVEINASEQKDAHLFVLMNSGLRPSAIDLLTDNPHRFVFREISAGEFTAWFPVEVTLVGKSFEMAWNRGAEQYYQYAILKGGLAKGAVKIVEVF